jgi:hypothetical protein
LQQLHLKKSLEQMLLDWLPPTSPAFEQKRQDATKDPPSKISSHFFHLINLAFHLLFRLLQFRFNCQPQEENNLKSSFDRKTVALTRSRNL